MWNSITAIHLQTICLDLNVYSFSHIAFFKHTCLRHTSTRIVLTSLSPPLYFSLSHYLEFIVAINLFHNLLAFCLGNCNEPILILATGALLYSVMAWMGIGFQIQH